MRRGLILLLIALPVFGKSLHWRQIDVQARLDGEGRLHVVERQRMVFDGDWNGGERNFNLRNRQTLVLHRLMRVEDGREIPLVAGDLDAVDHYDFTSKSIVRWRSRMPGDPPFESRELTYVLDYTYENVLEVDGGKLVLWHDFGLPERQGVIDHFTLKLDFDPVWQTAPVVESRAEVQPGRGVVVRRDFASAPAALVESLTPPLPWAGMALQVAFAVAVVVMIVMFVRAESELGRFARVAPALDEEVLKLRAEVVGAIWDADVGAPEVAATLARLEQEGKITTRVEKKVLHMKLNVSPSEMSGYERLLVAKIFGGDDTMDTKRLKQRYKGSGFNPAKEITPGIETALAEVVPRWNGQARRYSRKSHIVTLAGSALLLAGFGFLDSESVGEALAGLFFCGVFGLLACAVAYVKARAITGLARAFLGPALLFAIPILLFWMCAARALPGGRVSLPVTIAFGLWVLAMIRLALDLLKMREPREVVALRKRVVGVRKFFVEELRKPQPALRDEWFPYLLAFGLGKNADRWFRAFGSAGSHASSSSSSGWSGSSSSSSSSWTGGGGSFGGAGATGSWAVAAAGVAAGVASPSSSGGGGGGGSSSGGGGGGGW